MPSSFVLHYLHQSHLLDTYSVKRCAKPSSIGLTCRASHGHSPVPRDATHTAAAALSTDAIRGLGYHNRNEVCAHMLMTGVGKWYLGRLAMAYQYQQRF